MFYEYHLTTPINTQIASPQQIDMPLDYGILIRVDVEFPSGCAGLVGARIIERGHQRYPTNPDQWFVTDGRVITLNEAYKFFSPPFLMFLQTYNLDDTYPHTVSVRINIIRPEETLSRVISDIFFGLNAMPPGAELAQP